MKKIAILTCRQACDVCTGAACFNAWNLKKGGFAPYARENAMLAAFFHCNGCGTPPETDTGMLEKLDRLQSMGVSAVHTGVCTVPHGKTEQCPTIQKISEMLKTRGIPVIHGTH